MGRLSTHVLDTVNGRPAAGVRIVLHRLDGEAREPVAETRTNADGRTDAPLMTGDAMRAGAYEILFHVGDYFRAAGVATADPAFLDVVPVRFAIADVAGHYHVPLLVSPWSYSTYRGS
jgi:5-hydroxyisourate hydrolase